MLFKLIHRMFVLQMLFALAEIEGMFLLFRFFNMNECGHPDRM